MSQPNFYTILDECLARQRQGEALAACLADYPEQAAKLNPALAISAELYQLPSLEPRPEIVARGYEAMMSALPVQERPSRLAGLMAGVGKLLAPLRPQKEGRFTFALRGAMLLLVVVVVSGVFAITASANSLPGDTLYPVKRSWENTRLALTASEPSRQALESKFAEQRRQEVQAVLELRRPVTVEFQGRLQSKGDDGWLVDGLMVEVRDDTEVLGTITVGGQVTVRAQVQRDGSLVALQIKGEEDGSRGTIVPTDEPGPTRTAQPTREDTPTREATPTDEVSDEPSERPTLELEATREPTATWEPAATAEPTIKVEPTASPAPELNDATNDRATPTPEKRPTPTEEPANETGTIDKPTRDDKPTPEPTATKEPEIKPTATKEARPTATKATDASGGSDRPKNG